MDTKITYSISWSFIGGNQKHRFTVNKVILENGKTKLITPIKKFTTNEKATEYVKSLNEGSK